MQAPVWSEVDLGVLNSKIVACFCILLRRAICQSLIGIWVEREIWLDT